MQGIVKTLNAYWRGYGGIFALLSSAYLWAAFALALGATLWGKSDQVVWAEIASNLIPSLLGFTLGGYALLVGIGNDRLRDAMRQGDEPGQEPSPYIRFNAAFVHFLNLQILSLIFYLVARVFSIDNVWFNFIASWVVYYAVFSVLAAVLALFTLADTYDKLPHD